MSEENKMYQKKLGEEAQKLEELEEREELEGREELEERVEEQTGEPETIAFLSRKNLYSRIKVSTKTMDTIIVALIVILLVCLVLGIFVIK